MSRILNEHGEPIIPQFEFRPVRKKPVEVAAAGPVESVLYVETLEGLLRAEPGDMIIRGIAGELYPCKPEIFKQTYEEVIE